MLNHTQHTHRKHRVHCVSWVCNTGDVPQHPLHRYHDLPTHLPVGGQYLPSFSDAHPGLCGPPKALPTKHAYNIDKATRKKCTGQSNESRTKYKPPEPIWSPTISRTCLCALVPYDHSSVSHPLILRRWEQPSAACAASHAVTSTWRMLQPPFRTYYHGHCALYCHSSPSPQHYPTRRRKTRRPLSDTASQYRYEASQKSFKISTVWAFFSAK